MKKIDIGVIIVNKNNQAIGYSEKKGFFTMQESFFSEKSQNLMSEEILWFTNIKDSEIPKNNKNYKSNSYFDIEIDQILMFYGLNPNRKNLKIVLRKFFDFVSIYIKNSMEVFKLKDLEDVNMSFKRKRRQDRQNLILKSTSYKNLLISISSSFSESALLETIEVKSKSSKIAKKIQLKPIDVYSKIKFKDERTSDFIKIFESKKTKDLDARELRENSFVFTIPTLNQESVMNIPHMDFYKAKSYKNIDIESKLKENKSYSDVISNNFLFLYIEFKCLLFTKDGEERDDYPSIFKKLNNKKKMVSKEEYIWYCNSGFFNIKLLEGITLNNETKEIIYKERKLKKKLFEIDLEMESIKEKEDIKQKIRDLSKLKDRSFVFNTQILKHTMTKELFCNKLQHYIHIFNYLQIVFLNDNFLLNEWIKSQLLKNNLLLIKDLELAGINVISYSYHSIEVDVSYETKDILRKELENRGVLYPAGLL